MNAVFKIITGLTVFLGIMLAQPLVANAAILFQNDSFATVESDSMVINSDNESSGNIIMQFGQTLGEYLQWNSSNTRFELSDDLDLGSNQLTSARMENVSALPGGAGGLGVGGTGRVVELTATDTVAPGCTVLPNCVSGTYSWDGTAWSNLSAVTGLSGNANDVQYNTGSGFGGEDAFEYDAANNQLTVPGLSIIGNLSLTNDISPAQLTADVNDWNPTGLSTATIVRVDGNNTFRSIKGIAGGTDGRVIRLQNVGSNAVLLRHENTGSTAANRFDLGGYDLPLFSSSAITLRYDGTSSRWRVDDVYSHLIPTARFGLYYSHDMTDTASFNGLSSQVSGTGADNDRTVVTGVVGHPAIIQHQTGTTATGIAAMQTINNAIILLANNWFWNFEAMVRIPTLSDGTNTFTYRAGFMDSATGDSTDGCYFRYTHSVASGQWQGVCRSNGTESVTGAGPAVVANTWYRLSININPSGTGVRFFVNDTEISSGITSNVPTGAGRGTGFGSSIVKSAGTTERLADLDYIEAIGYDNTST